MRARLEATGDNRGASLVRRSRLRILQTSTTSTTSTGPCRGPSQGSLRVSDVDDPSGVSQATPQGRLIAGAGALGSQPGWRGRAGRTVAWVTLVGGVVAVIAVIVGVVVMSR